MQEAQWSEEDHHLVRVYPGEKRPEIQGPPLKEDWCLFWPDGSYEVHELCLAAECQYRPEPCPFHPPDCECSFGSCLGNFQPEEI